VDSSPEKELTRAYHLDIFRIFRGAKLNKMKSFDIVTNGQSALDKALISQDWFLNKIVVKTPLFDAGGGGINKAISRLEENHYSNNFWRIDRRNAEKSFTRRINFFEAIETRSGHGKISLQLMTTRIQFRFVFRHHRYNR
jgi:hypothetical protein